MDREDTVTHLENQAWIDCEKKLGYDGYDLTRDLTVVDPSGRLWDPVCQNS